MDGRILRPQLSLVGTSSERDVKNLAAVGKGRESASRRGDCDSLLMLTELGCRSVTGHVTTVYHRKF